MSVRVIRHDRNGDGPAIVLLAGWRQRVERLAEQANLTAWCERRGVDLLLLEKHAGWFDMRGHLNWTPGDMVDTQATILERLGTGDAYGYGFSDAANHVLRCWRVFKGCCYFSGAAGSEQTLDATDAFAGGTRLVLCCRKAGRRGVAARTRRLAEATPGAPLLQHEDIPGRWFQHAWDSRLNDQIWNLLTRRLD